jgi:hypothetical protein
VLGDKPMIINHGRKKLREKYDYYKNEDAYVADWQYILNLEEEILFLREQLEIEKQKTGGS